MSVKDYQQSGGEIVQPDEWFVHSLFIFISRYNGKNL